MNLPDDIDNIETPEELRPRIARQLGLPLLWDQAIDALPSPSVMWPSGWFAKLCRVYRILRPRKIGDRCAFEPSCSRYAEISFRVFGLRKSLSLTFDRLKRCNAQNGGLDLPPNISENPSNLERELHEI